MDESDLLLTMVNNIKKKISNANTILIIASRPIDYDCLGTTLIIRWYLENILKKEVSTYTFTTIPDHIKHFPNIDFVEQRYVNEVDFNYYDLIILPDGNEFRQFLTNDYKKVMALTSLDKFVSIDHHLSGKIEEEIADSTVRKLDSCTAKVFYDYFLKDEDINIPQEVIQYIYMALIGDTGVFSHAIFKDTFSFAQQLIDLGADHYKAVDLSIPKEMMDFTAWAIENTKYYKESMTSILEIDMDKKSYLNNTFGEEWESKNLSRYYVNQVMRMVEDYPYSLILTVNNDLKSVKLIYRVKNYNANIDLTEVLSPYGFDLKGHKKAGGGIINNVSLLEAISKYNEAMKKAQKVYII